jgi:hypothetical protein
MNSAKRLPTARTENLLVQKLNDETLIYDIERDEAHCLNQTAALVWEKCDGKTTAAQAAQSVQRKLGTPFDTDVVWLAVKQLQRYHLIDRKAMRPSVSRRDLVIKYAPLAISLPIIFSITAPTPAQAATCAGDHQSCATIPCCPGFSCDGICFPVGARATPG